jgi:hypothetical protein
MVTFSLPLLMMSIGLVEVFEIYAIDFFCFPISVFQGSRNKRCACKSQIWSFSHLDYKKVTPMRKKEVQSGL